MRSWLGTKYVRGQSCKGAGVDCVGFVLGIINEMCRWGDRVKRVDFPQDASMHNPRGALAVMKQIADTFAPYERVEGTGIVEPGDVIVVGPQNGGPGHGMIVGAQKNTIWHSTGRAVQFTGMDSLRITRLRIFRVYRYLEKRRWLS